MTGMETVLAKHEPHIRSYGDYLQCACGGWDSMGGRDGEWPTHLTQALIEAGYGLLPEPPADRTSKCMCGTTPDPGTCPGKCSWSPTSHGHCNCTHTEGAP